MTMSKRDFGFLKMLSKEIFKDSPENIFIDEFIDDKEQIILRSVGDLRLLTEYAVNIMNCGRSIGYECRSEYSQQDIINIYTIYFY